MKISITIAFLFFIITSFAQINDESAFFNGDYDKGYIKTSKIKTVTVSGYIDTSKLGTSIFYFDRSGILLHENIIDSSGNEINRFAFDFNKHGDLIKQITRPYKKYNADTIYYNKVYKGKQLIQESSTMLPIKIEHIYYHKGQRIETVNPYYTGMVSQSKRVVRNEYDKAGKLTHVTVCILNANTDAVEMWMSDRTIIYIGDKIQQVIEKIASGDIPNNRGNMEYSYDAAGNILSIASDTVASYYYTYNTKGLLSSKRTKMPEGFDELSVARMVNEYSYSFWK